MLRCVLLRFGSARLVRRANINSLRLCVVLAPIDRSSRDLFEREGTTLFVWRQEVSYCEVALRKHTVDQTSVRQGLSKQSEQSGVCVNEA